MQEGCWRFAEYKKKVAETFLGLNLDGIIDIEPEKGEEEEGKAREVEETAKGAMDIEAKQAIIEEIVAEAMVEAKAMIEEVVNAFNAG